MNKIRLLVVDDQPRLARIIRFVLEDSGLYEVLLETRSDQVLATTRSYRPAAILLDVDMPQKNGAEVARDLWNEPDLRPIPILFFTGLVMAHEIGLRDTPHGKKRFISKMVEPAVLLHEIENLLEESSADSFAIPLTQPSVKEENNERYVIHI